MTEVAAAYICENGRFMICQRPENKARGLLWEFVGGKLEPGETPQQALVRECMEELDITVTPEEPYMDVIHKYPDITVHLYVIKAIISQGEPKLLEHNDLKWITPDEIDQYDFCPADEDILKKIKEDHRNTLL